MSSTDSVTFTFENLASYHGGQHKYTIREKRGLDDYTSYDTTNYEAIVTVIDSGEGYLQTSTEYRKNDAIVSEAEFVNRKLTDLDIVKKDESTLATIPNARFTIISNNKYLHSDGTFSDEPEEFITGSNGYINLEKIPAGTYTLHETRAPEGYIKAADIVFIVDENGIVVNNESVDEITVLEEPITHDIMIGKTVSGSMGDTNKEFEFEIKFSKITDMRLQYTRKAAIFSNGTSYSGAGSYIPGYNDMTRAQQIAAIKALPLKENGNEILMAVTGSNNAKVTLRETTISSVSGSGSNEGIITIYTYADDNLGVYGFYEVKAYGPKTLVDIDNTPAGAERTATGTYKVNLKHNETITFEDIPYGIWYTVTEKRANQDGYVTSVTTQVGTATASAVVKGVLTDNESISYTNISDGISPTGIETTRLKLFAFMLTAALICVLYLRKKKANRT